MLLSALIGSFRTDSNDKAQPYFWSDDEVTIWFNEAENEAAIRGRLIHESSNAAVCNIAVTAGQSVYPLHDALYELSHVRFRDIDDKGHPSIRLVSTGELDAHMPEWRGLEGMPECAIQGDTDIRLAPTPVSDGTLYLEGYRLPLAPMLIADKDTVEPEINPAHHRHLVQWVLFRAFSVPDTEAFDANRSAQAEEAFTQYFGLRPDSDLRRITREDVQHTTKAYWV